MSDQQEPEQVYARVVDGEVAEIASVPPYGEYADGSTVSGPLTDWSDAELAEVGWLPVIGTRPEGAVTGPTYKIKGSSVVMVYEAAAPPVPAPEAQVITDHADKAQAVLDGKASFTKAESDQILAAFVRQNTPQVSS